MVPSKSEDGEPSNEHTSPLHSTVKAAAGRSLTPPAQGLQAGLWPHANHERPVPFALIVDTKLQGPEPVSMYGSRATKAMRAPSEDQVGAYAYVPGLIGVMTPPSGLIVTSSVVGMSPPPQFVEMKPPFSVTNRILVPSGDHTGP